MTKASDNIFPKLLILEGTAPSSPSSGDQALFIDSSDHHLKRKNSSGTVTDIESGGGAPVANVARTLYSGGDKTTTSSSFVDLDATNASITLTTGAHRVRVVFNATITSNGANAVAFDIDIDGTLQSGGATFGLAATNIKGNSIADIICIDYVSAALTAASHTIKIKWRTSGGTATCYASLSVSPLHMSVEELQA